jgi:integrase
MPGARGIKHVKRPGSDMWYARGSVRGQPVFESTGTTDEESARAYCAKREAEIWQRSIFGTRATVTFTHAVAAYIASKKLSPSDSKRVDNLVLHFKATKLDKIDQEALDRAYAVLLPAGASNANKTRTVLAPLRTILNFAARRKWCDVPKFDVPPKSPPRVAYLLPEQVTSLIQHAAPHLRPLIAFCVYTGARMSEALELEWDHIDLFANRVTFWKTKGKRARRYNMPPAAVATLSAISHREGHVFLVPAIINKNGETIIKAHPFHNNERQAGGQIKTGWASACKRAGITGFRPHDLRHTWASWQYCLHKDLMKVRDDGGWQSTDQVEIYAHLIPDAYRTQIDSLLNGVPAAATRKEA